jgi:hypothetical protein
MATVILPEQNHTFQLFIILDRPSTFLAHIRSLILCTVTTSVITLGLRAPSLNICNYCLTGTVVDTGIYVTSLSWQFDTTMVAVFG